MYIIIITYYNICTCITHLEVTRWALNSLKLEPKLSPIAKS